MLLKKQTVWLLTMLSLVVVLSVHYITSEPGGNDLAAIGNEDAGKMSEQDYNIITEAAGDEVFDQVRMDLQDKRGEQIDEMTTQVGSDELSADEKNVLYDQMQDIKELAVQEQTMESLIKQLGYSDALVRVENGQVNVLVKSSEDHTRAEAVKILKIVRETVGTHLVADVEFQTN